MKKNKFFAYMIGVSMSVSLLSAPSTVSAAVKKAPISYNTVLPKNTLKVATVTEDSISFNWLPVSGANSYQVKRNGVLIKTKEWWDFQYHYDIGLMPNTTYNYEVVSLKNNVVIQSEKITIKTLPIPAPNTPINFKASNVTDSIISLSWSPSKNAKEYVLKRNGVVVYKGPSTSFSNQKLNPNTYYNFELTASNNAGTSKPITSMYRTTATPTKTPTIAVKSNAYASRDVYAIGDTIQFITVVENPLTRKPLSGAVVTVTIHKVYGGTIEIPAVVSTSDVFTKIYLPTNKSFDKGSYSASIKVKHPDYIVDYNMVNFQIK